MSAKNSLRLLLFTGNIKKFSIDNIQQSRSQKKRAEKSRPFWFVLF